MRRGNCGNRYTHRPACQLLLKIGAETGRERLLLQSGGGRKESCSSEAQNEKGRHRRRVERLSLWGIEGSP